MLEGEEQEGKKESGRARERERKRAKQGVIDSCDSLGVCLLLFVTSVPIIKLFARGEGSDSGGHV